MTELNHVAVTSAPLLRAIKAGGWTTPAELAEKAGRGPKNIARDLTTVRNAGLVDEQAIALTNEGEAQLAAITRAEGGELVAAGDVAGDPGHLRLTHDQIQPDPDNARRDWDSEDAAADLQALAQDIEANDLLQNLVVRQTLGENGLSLVHVLVGGERRWRAIGKLIDRGAWPADKLIPCRLLDADEVGIRLAALAENLQRRNLNPIEEANAYRGLREVGLTTEQIAERVMMTQRHVQSRLQLLEHLDEDQQRRMTLAGDDADRLSVSEARKLVQAAEAPRKAREKAETDLTPRQRLIFTEVVLARKEGYLFSRVPVDPFAMNADDDAVALHKAGLLFLPTTVDLDGTANTYLENAAWNVMQALYPDGEGTTRADYADALRSELDLPQPAAGAWSTPWLNPPFDLPEEVQADLAARLAAREAENQQWQERRNAEAEAAQQRRDRMSLSRVHAEALTAKAADAPSMPVVDDAPQLARQLERPLPWRATEGGTVIDADGATVTSFCEMYRGPTDREIGLALLTAASINAAAGLPTPPLLTKAEAEARTPALIESAFTEAVSLVLAEAEAEINADPLEQAEAILKEFLDSNGVAFGDDGFDWTKEGARQLAQQWIDDQAGED